MGTRVVLRENENNLLLHQTGKALGLRLFPGSVIYSFIAFIITVFAMMVTGMSSGVAQAAPTSVTTEPFESPLQLGLLPYVSTRKLFTYYLPLKQHLERTLGRSVRMSTAPDFATYSKRAREGSYDLYHTAPHFAAQAEVEFGYRRVSRYVRELDGSIVVARDSAIHEATDLRGHTLFTPDSLAIITFLGEQWLRDNGMQPGIDVKVKHTPSHNNAILAVMHGEADAAVTSAAVFEKMPADIKKHLRILGSTQKVPNVMFMAGPNLPEAEYRQLRQAMLSFTAKGAGQEFFEMTGYVDMVEITDNDMQALLPFVAQLKTKTKTNFR